MCARVKSGATDDDNTRVMVSDLGPSLSVLWASEEFEAIAHLFFLISSFFFFSLLMGIWSSVGSKKI